MMCLVLEHNIFTEIMKDLVGHKKIEPNEYLPILKTFRDFNKSDLRFKHTLRLLCDNFLAYCKNSLQDSPIINGGLELSVGFGRRMNNKLGTRLYELLNHKGITDVIDSGKIDSIEQALALKSYCRFLWHLGKPSEKLKKQLWDIKYVEKPPIGDERFDNYNKLVRLYNSLKLVRSSDYLNKIIIDNKDALISLFANKLVRLDICVDFRNQSVNITDKILAKDLPFTLKDINNKYITCGLIYGIFVNNKKLNKTNHGPLVYRLTIRDYSGTTINYNEYIYSNNV
jgi:hypothetical protein